MFSFGDMDVFQRALVRQKRRSSGVFLAVLHYYGEKGVVVTIMPSKYGTLKVQVECILKGNLTLNPIMSTVLFCNVYF